MVEVIRVGVNEGLGEEAKKAATIGAGVAGGFVVSGFAGEYVAKATKLSGNEAILAKVVTRIGIGAVFAVLSFMTGGLASVVLFGATAGAVGGAMYDVICHYLLKGSPEAVAERMIVGGEVADIVRRNLEVENVGEVNEPIKEYAE